MSGRFIGPKSWNRNVIIFLDPFVQSVAILGTVLSVV